MGTHGRARAAIRALATAAAAVLTGGGAAAESYEVLLGEARAVAPGAAHGLSGMFEAALAPFDPGPGQRVLLVDDFALRVGERVFTPPAPIVFEGLEPVLYLRVADGIVLAGDAVEAFLFRSGGEAIASDEDTVTFRFLDFRSWTMADPDAPVDAGDGVGELDDDGTPRRLRLSGSLFATDETFEIRREPCPPPPVLDPPGDGGGVIVGGGVSGGGGLISDFASFDLDPDETVAFVPPGDSTGVLARVTGGGSSGVEGGLGGELTPPLGPPVFDTCPGLFRLGLPEETVLGRVELVATAARPIAVDVAQRQRRGGVLHPGGRVPVSVVVRGDGGLDVREVDPASLRLGPDAAEPRGRVRFVDLPRDGFPDLLARFRARETGIAYGDRFVCLLGETVLGELLEGCDAIAALPAAAHRLRHGRD